MLIDVVIIYHAKRRSHRKKPSSARPYRDKDGVRYEHSALVPMLVIYGAVTAWSTIPPPL